MRVLSMVVAESVTPSIADSALTTAVPTEPLPPMMGRVVMDPAASSAFRKAAVAAGSAAA